MIEVLIYLFCLLSIGSALTTCLSSKIIRSTFFFGITLFLIAFIFIVVGSNLLGVVQILLYTGGTLILFLFSIFLTGDWDYSNLGETFHKPVSAVLIAFFFFLTTSYLITTSEIFIKLENKFNINKIVSTQDISVSLFNDWIFILELSSILLLATIVGCLTLLKFRKEID